MGRELPDLERDQAELIDHLARKHDYRSPIGQSMTGLRHVHENSHRFPRNIPHRHTHLKGEQ